METAVRTYRVVCDYCGDVWVTVSPYDTAVVLASKHAVRMVGRDSNAHQVHVEDEV